MPVLQLSYLEVFSADIDQLRMECFPGCYPDGTAKDEFDDRSLHLTARIDKKLAAYMRLTPGPNAYFESVHRQRGNVPTGANVVDFNRAMVAPADRGNALFELLVIEGLMFACDKGFRKVVGASSPSRGFRSLLHRLGFVDTESAMPAHLPNGEIIIGLPLVAYTQGKRALWDACKSDTLARIRERGFVIVESAEASPNLAAGGTGTG